MRDKRLQLRVNSERVQAWYKAAAAESRTFSTWAVVTLSAKKAPALSTKSHKDQCDDVVVIYYRQEDRQLWEKGASEANLDLSEWIRRALDKASGLK